MSGPPATDSVMGGVPEDHAQVRVVAPIIFSIAFVAGALLERLFPLPSLTAAPRWAIGAGSIALGLWIGLGALRAMNHAGTSPNPYVASTALVERGPYRWTRNPMYLSMLVIFAGLAVLLRATLAFAFLIPAAFVVQHAVIQPEERYLEGRFGEAYAGYKSRVRRWI